MIILATAYVVDAIKTISEIKNYATNIVPLPNPLRMIRNLIQNMWLTYLILAPPLIWIMMNEAWCYTDCFYPALLSALLIRQFITLLRSRKKYIPKSQRMRARIKRFQHLVYSFTLNYYQRAYDDCDEEYDTPTDECEQDANYPDISDLLKRYGHLQRDINNGHDIIDGDGKWSQSKPGRLQQWRKRMLTLYLSLFHSNTAESISLYPNILSLHSRAIGTSCNGATDHSYDADSFVMLFDNGSSKCITSNINDFVDKPRMVNVPVAGMGGESRATLVGTVTWSIEDDEGRTHSFRVPNTFYNASAPFRLMSPQHLIQELNEQNKPPTWYEQHMDCIKLYWNGGTNWRTIHIDAKSNVFFIRSMPGFEMMQAFCTQIADIPSSLNEREFMAYPNFVSDEEHSAESESTDPTQLPASRRSQDLPDEVFPDELLLHTPDEVSFEQSQSLRRLKTHRHRIPEDLELQFDNPQAELLAWHYRMGHLPFDRIRAAAERGDLPSRLLKAKVPKCAACLFGKMTRQPWRSKVPINQMKVPMATAPGDVVGVDQLVSTTPGLIGQMRGFITRKRYSVTTVFVDYFSGLSFVHLQTSTNANQTIDAKDAWERYAKAHGVTIKHYHADNGIFAEKAFVMAVQTKGQTITYCAVNAHHQNGRAEKKIRDLQETARTMILHAKQRWPHVVTTNLWPYAIRMANDVANATPGIKNRTSSPIEVFSQVDISPRVKHLHVFGSPVYVLDSAVQAGKHIPKWQNKARVGLYLGASPRHSRKVALVLSLSTGHVSPQFHCKFDDLFETTRASAGNPVIPSRWQIKTGFDKEVERPLQPTLEVLPQPNEDHQGEELNDELPELPPNASVDDDDASADSEHGIELMEEFELQPHDPLYDTTTRSGRIRKPTTRLIESTRQRELGIVSYNAVPWEVFHDGGYEIQEAMEDPIAYAFAASSNPDILYLDEAMKAQDQEQFREAMLLEIQSHTENDHWEVIPKSLVPVGKRILAAVWAFRRKRRIATQQVYKWKARINIHGGQQEFGVNFWETYSPVVGWPTIRLFLVMMLLNSWASKQVDFVLAFPQADIECDMFMEVPQGFEFEGSRRTHCLKLKKNLYGQKQAGRVWNQFLHDGLLARGFKQSQVDMCVYYRGKVALLIYVDDGILIGPTEKEIQVCYDLLSCEFIDSSGKKFRKFKITDEGDLSDYLGVKIDKLSNGTIKLSQPHLIDQIICDLGFNDKTTPKSTPSAASVKLHRDIDGLPMNEEWIYRSVVGKMNFLEKSTRPEIAFAVHQCARFSNDPKESHATAIKRIGKYLVATRDKGIIFNPQDHSFDVFVDADFVGNWNRVNADTDPGTAKSRTGYIVLYGGCPMTWASKLQREVALSTTEAEYNALSESLRPVIQLMQIIEEIKEVGWQTTESVPVIHCKVFEDNSGALEMSRLPKMRPRTKHIGVRMHHFREHVRTGRITIHKIPTEYQLADIATKPQTEKLFVAQRESLLQWAAETMTKDELLLPAEHLRACEIIKQAEALNNQASLDKLKGQPGLMSVATIMSSYIGILLFGDVMAI